MLEMFNELFSFCAEIFSLPLIRVVLALSFSLFPIFCLSRMIGSLLDFDFSDVFFCIGTWIKNKFIDLLKNLFGFDFIYKLGFARPGVDYVECNIQDCDSCPFRFMGTCPPERQAEFKNMKD